MLLRLRSKQKENRGKGTKKEESETKERKRKKVYKRKRKKEKRKMMCYLVLCKDCNRTYIGETKRTLKVRLGEHKQAVRRGDPNNGIAIQITSTSSWCALGSSVR